MAESAPFNNDIDEFWNCFCTARHSEVYLPEKNNFTSQCAAVEVNNRNLFPDNVWNLLSNLTLLP